MLVGLRSQVDLLHFALVLAEFGFLLRCADEGGRCVRLTAQDLRTRRSARNEKLFPAPTFVDFPTDET